jgi:hypothetical protein
MYEPVFQLNLSNYGLHYGEKYVLDTYDMLIGVVGGLYALIWALFSYCISDFESFNKSTGLIADFYSSEDPKNKDSRKNNNQDMTEKEVEERVKAELNARTMY